MTTDHDRFVRPPTPEGFDRSRATERAADPRGWRYEDAARDAVHRVIAERRDIRRFRPDDVPDDVLERVLAAAHRAPSVGLMQPWRFIVVRDVATRAAVRTLAQRERVRQAERFDARARHFLDQKIEGVVEAPLGVVVCCDPGDPGAEILGRGTIPETDVYSTACAIENLWLAARAEGLGVGWVSFYRPPDLRDVLRIPDRVIPMAYLCVGWPDERPVRPGLEAAGWSSRLPLERVVMAEKWEGAEHVAAARAGADRRALTAARDRADTQIRPSGSLGLLEGLVERWAAVTGSPPPPKIRAGVLLCAADHGHTTHGSSLYGAAVSRDIAAAAARGESSAAVLAAAGGHALRVADVGLAAPTPEGVLDRKVAAGTADVLTGPAMTAAQGDAAMQAGAALADELIDEGVGCLVLGEVGIGNTTTAGMLAAALTGATPDQVVGRGVGVDAAGLERKRAMVADAVARHADAIAAGPRAALAALGGLELAALAGAAARAWERRIPVILDGFAATVPLLVTVREDATAADALVAGHRSPEPGHGVVLAELGLEPLLDLRMRVGEGAGALMALGVIERAGALHAGLGAFAEPDQPVA